MRTRMDRAEPGAPSHRTSHSRSRAGDRAHVGLAYREKAGDGASRDGRLGQPERGLGPTATLIAYHHLHWSLRSRFRLGAYYRGTLWRQRPLAHIIVRATPVSRSL
jgi:hypothetical protein